MYIPPTYCEIYHVQSQTYPVIEQIPFAEFPVDTILDQDHMIVAL